MLESLVVEAVAAKGVGKLSVDGAPGREHRLAVGVAEVGKYVGYLAHSLVDGQLVGSAQSVDNGLGCGYENVLAVEVLDALEQLHADALWHEVAP